MLKLHGGIVSLQTTLADILRAQGLPEEPEKFVGRTFVFGEESHFVGGIITSFGLGPKEGLKLYVSAPRFRGKEIRHICVHTDPNDEGAWYAVAENRNEEAGAFKLVQTNTTHNMS